MTRTPTSSIRRGPRGRRLLRWAPAVLACVALGQPAVSRAQDRPDDARIARAKDYFEAGKEAYAAGQYTVAITAFEEAYRLAPRSAIVFTLAQAHRRQYVVDARPANLAAAVRLYKQYLDEVPQGGRRNDTVQHLETLEPVLRGLEASGALRDLAGAKAPALTQLMVSSRTPGARGSIDGGSLSEVPVTAEVGPGKHTVRVEAPGYFAQEIESVAVEGRLILAPVDLEPMPATLSFRAPAGARVEIDGRAVPGRKARIPAGRYFVAVTERGHRPFARELDLARGQELTVDAPLERTTQRRVSYYVLGAAAALVVAGGVTTGLALAAQGEAEDIRSQLIDDQVNITADDVEEHNDAIAERNSWRSTTYLVLGGAVAAGAAGALLYWIDNPRVEAPDSGPAIVPAVSEHSVGAALIGRFD